MAPVSPSALQAYLRREASRHRETERVGPFLATFNPASDHPFLNYAIPDDGASPSAAEVAALIAAYDARNRVPRLEYLPETAPGAEAALLAGGLSVESRLPLMVCRPEDTVAVPAPEGFILAAPATDADLLATAAAQREAFGDPPPTDGDAAWLRQTLSSGGVVVMARHHDGGVVGAGMCPPPIDGMTELAGIGVHRAWRRRGLAGAMTAELTAGAFTRGATLVFLTPGDDGAERVYERAGFVTATHILHIRRV